ncbi:hypothetical protein PENTCL1PPCAC_14183, partial [Pristionchus entomophagus]
SGFLHMQATTANDPSIIVSMKQRSDEGSDAENASNRTPIVPTNTLSISVFDDDEEGAGTAGSSTTATPSESTEQVQTESIKTPESTGVMKLLEPNSTWKNSRVGKDNEHSRVAGSRRKKLAVSDREQKREESPAADTSHKSASSEANGCRK